jgi:hypothetical protein
MDGQGGGLSSPAKHECVGSWVWRDCEAGRGNAGFRGEFADLGFKPTVFARSEVVQMACGSDNDWTYQVLEQYNEESSYKAKYESCEGVEEESGYDKKKTEEYGED